MATKHPRAALLLCALFLLSACAEAPTWYKDGADEMTLQGDLSACRKQAQVMYGPPGSTMPTSQIDSRFGPTGPSPADQAMREGQMVGSCMRGKGYVLKAVEKK
jgi:hypothetical protein